MWGDAMTASKTNRWLVLLVVSSALFLIVVDMSVLHTALPTLTRELHANAAEKLWIMNAYALVVAGLLPGCGTLGDRGVVTSACSSSALRGSDWPRWWPP